MKDKLKISPVLTIKDLNDILYAYQIATGHATGTGQIMGILEFLEEGNVLEFTDIAGKMKILKDKFDFGELINSFDSSVDITNLSVL